MRVKRVARAGGSKTLRQADVLGANDIALPAATVMSFEVPLWSSKEYFFGCVREQHTSDSSQSIHLLRPLYWNDNGAPNYWAKSRVRQSSSPGTRVRFEQSLKGFRSKGYSKVRVASIPVSNLTADLVRRLSFFCAAMHWRFGGIAVDADSVGRVRARLATCPLVESSARASGTSLM